MGKRDALLRANTPSINTTTAQSNNFIDSIVAQVSEEVMEPEKVVKSEPVAETPKPEQAKSKVPKKNSGNEEEPQINPNFQFEVKKKQKKTVHKNFLISEELNKKYQALAKSTGQNENELFNSILEQLFKV